MGRVNTRLAGAAGEHFVMYRLLKKGYLAALTPQGADGVDILISDISGGHLAAIQVKTSSTKVRDGWRMDAKHEWLIRDTLYYCFVCPGENVGPDGNVTTLPTCWIVPSKGNYIRN